MPPPIYIFEDSQFDRFYPLTYSRPAFLLRCGALTLLERIARAVGTPIAGVLVRQSIAGVIRGREVPANIPVNPPLSTKDGVVLINGRWLALAEKDQHAPLWEEPYEDTAGLVLGSVAWVNLSAATAASMDLSRIIEAKTLELVLPSLRRLNARARLLDRPWDLFPYQDAALRADFSHLGPANHATVMPGAHLLNPQNIHLAPGVKIYPGVVLDAQNGPIIIEENSEIRANAVITGPVHVGKHCIIRTAADIRERSSIGPHSRVGGEVAHSIFLGQANKQHHGFLGQTIVGQWANLGAGTTTSNLKNTYGTVRVPINGTEEETNQQFIGSIIGDHAKLGIGTYLSTGSVIGFSSHIITPRPPKFIPSFAWVTDKGTGGVARADFDKLVAIAATVMGRRNVTWTPADHELFVHIAGEYATGEKFEWTP